MLLMLQQLQGGHPRGESRGRGASPEDPGMRVYPEENLGGPHGERPGVQEADAGRELRRLL